MSIIDEDYILPCDVFLPPATVIRKGCRLSTLLAGLRNRNGSQDWNKFTAQDLRLLVEQYRKAVEDVNP